MMEIGDMVICLKDMFGPDDGLRYPKVGEISQIIGITPAQDGWPCMLILSEYPENMFWNAEGFQLVRTYKVFITKLAPLLHGSHEFRKMP